MSQHTGQTSVARREAQAMRDLTPAELRTYLEVETTLAQHLTGDTQVMALDHNARLFTQLRELRLWPPRPGVFRPGNTT